MKAFLLIMLFCIGMQLQSVSQDVGVIYAAEEAEEGDGAALLRLFPSASFKHADPFILLDDFSVQPPAGFPPHEHKGFEAITYMLEGGFVHTDNLGNSDTVFAGAAQRFTAGKGLIHSEMPGTLSVNKGLQLWLNIPVTAKKGTPSYQKVEALPVQKYDSSGNIRTIVSGDSPVILHCGCDLTYLDVELKKNMITFTPVQGYTSFVYVLQGEIQIDTNILTERDFYFLASGVSTKIISSSDARFVYLSARPLNQPIKQRGPYVY